MVKYDLYVFPETVKRNNILESTKLDILEKDGITRLIFEFCGQIRIVNLDDLDAYSSTCIMCNFVNNEIYTVYNFRELLEVMNLTPKEMLDSLQQRCFVQIDKLPESACYIKAFTLKGERYLNSNNQSWCNLYYSTLDNIHPLDWKYSWNIRQVHIRIDKSDNSLHISFYLDKSVFYADKDIYACHAGQSVRLNEGLNEITFLHYNSGENVYIGNKNNHYKGRMLLIS